MPPLISIAKTCHLWFQIIFWDMARSSLGMVVKWEVNFPFVSIYSGREQKIIDILVNIVKNKCLYPHFLVNW